MQPHTNFGIPTSNNVGYLIALDTIILETRSEVKVKVTVTQKLYSTHLYPNMHPPTEHGIPTSKTVGDMV